MAYGFVACVASVTQANGFDSSLRIQAPALPTPLSNDALKRDSFTPILVKMQRCLGWEGEVFSYQSHWKSPKTFGLY